MEFNSLPLIVHLKIFSYLPCRDVMEIRLVCKQWKHLINSEFKFEKLRCLKFRKKDQSYFSNRKDSFDFSSSMKSFLENVNNDLKFREIKHLDASLFEDDELEDVFDFLNLFKSLEKVEFRIYGFDHRLLNDRPNPQNLNPAEEIERKQFVVRLDRLEKADFDFGRSLVKFSVVLNLPRLLYLAIDSLEKITITYPEKLRILATNGLFRANLDYSKFHDLTKIFADYKDLRSISASFIERLPRLKELHLDGYD